MKTKDKDLATRKKIGSRIQKVRKEKGLRQEEMADSVGLSLNSISRIERGNQGLYAENLKQICAVLDTSSDYFLFGKQNQKVSLKESVSMVDAGTPERAALIRDVMLDFDEYLKTKTEDHNG